MAAVLVVAVCVVGLIPVFRKEQAEPLVLDTKYVFDEDAFAQELAQPKDNNFNLAKNGECEYTIVYPSEIDDVNMGEDGTYSISDIYKNELRNTVYFFKDSLEQIVGCDIAIADDKAISSGKAIRLELTPDDESVSVNGYKIRVEGEDLVISAKEYRNIAFGIYGFMEDYLGCMFVATDYDFLPSLPTINLNLSEEIVEPEFDWRCLYSYDAWRWEDNNFDSDPDYLEWHSKLKLNGAGFDGWGNFVHTFYYYISPEEYFEEHPEYFSYYRGKRRCQDGPTQGQLCLTNEDVYQIILEKLFKEMEENPEVHYWEVSQMDTWGVWGGSCRCEDCKALDRKYGGPMGSLLTFINRLADDIAEQFPNNYISTLAYNYSIEPPKDLVPRDNVIIKMCAMRGDQASSYLNPKNKGAEEIHDNFSAWGKIAKNIVVWDYVVDFSEYLMPYPNLSIQKENNTFYIENNVMGMFHQGMYEKGTELSGLKNYIMAKLMWDKDLDVEATAQKYLSVYYGEAAPYIAEYINSTTENMLNAKQPLDLYSSVFSHKDDYLSVRNIDYYLELIAKAEQAAEDDQIILDRLEMLKANVLYAKADQYSWKKAERSAALKEFTELTEKYELDRYREADGEMDKFLVQCEKNIARIPLDITLTIVTPIAFAAAAYFAVLGIKKLVVYIKKKKKTKTQ